MTLYPLFYVAYACEEVGRTDQVLCNDCLGHSTVRYSELEPTEPLTCSYCGIVQTEQTELDDESEYTCEDAMNDAADAAYDAAGDR